MQFSTSCRLTTTAKGIYLLKKKQKSTTQVKHCWIGAINIKTSCHEVRMANNNSQERSSFNIDIAQRSPKGCCEDYTRPDIFDYTGSQLQRMKKKRLHHGWHSLFSEYDLLVEIQVQIMRIVLLQSILL